MHHSEMAEWHNRRKTASYNLKTVTAFGGLKSGRRVFPSGKGYDNNETVLLSLRQ